MPKITDFAPIGAGVYLYISWSEPHIIRVPFQFRTGFKVDGIDIVYTNRPGMITDLASIPRIFQGWMIEKLGAHMLPAVIHDQMCNDLWEDNKLAAEVFNEAMRFCRLPDDTRELMYSLVLQHGPKWDKVDHATR